jgi:hypothetical protein
VTADPWVLEVHQTNAAPVLTNSMADSPLLALAWVGRGRRSKNATLHPWPNEHVG